MIKDVILLVSLYYRTLSSALYANRDIIVLQERLEIPLKSRKLYIYIYIYITNMKLVTIYTHTLFYNTALPAL